jgi:hypothetical protein
MPFAHRSIFFPSLRLHSLEFTLINSLRILETLNDLVKINKICFMHCCFSVKPIFHCYQEYEPPVVITTGGSYSSLLHLTFPP